VRQWADKLIRSDFLGKLDKSAYFRQEAEEESPELGAKIPKASPAEKWISEEASTVTK
jgi:hypothetical protein